MVSFSCILDGVGHSEGTVTGTGTDEELRRVNSVKSAFGATTSLSAQSSHLSIFGGKAGTMSRRAALEDP